MDKKSTAKRILEIAVFIVIVALSVLIFIFRNDIGRISDWGYAGVFLLCLAANSTLFLPAPSLMIAASCALVMNPWLVALFASLGSAAGELVGYLFGRVSGDLSPKFKKITDWIAAKIKTDWLFVFILALLPLPLFDAAGIYSGGKKMNLLLFFGVCFAGKFIKTLFYTHAYSILEWVMPEL